MYEHLRKMQLFYLSTQHQILKGAAKLVDKRHIEISSMALSEWLATLDAHWNYMESFTVY